MKVTLWDLNIGYQALLRLSNQTLPKEEHKLSWKLKRIVKTAKAAMEDLSDHEADLMKKCGFIRGQQNVEIEKIDAFNTISRKFMKETETELWGDPIRYGEIKDHATISPLDLADLTWLIIDDAEASKTAQAAA